MIINDFNSILLLLKLNPAIQGLSISSYTQIMKKEEEINPNFEGLKQGISISRLINETVNQTVICPKCKNIFWNPRMCSESKCGNTLCEPCLQKSLLTSEICLKCEYPAKYIITSLNNKSYQNSSSNASTQNAKPKFHTMSYLIISAAMNLLNVR